LVLLYLVTRPIATPAAGEDIGIPASSSAKLPPQTVAIEEEPFCRTRQFYKIFDNIAVIIEDLDHFRIVSPFDSKTSLVSLIVNG